MIEPTSVDKQFQMMDGLWQCKKIELVSKKCYLGYSTQTSSEEHDWNKMGLQEQA